MCVCVPTYFMLPQQKSALHLGHPNLQSLDTPLLRTRFHHCFTVYFSIQENKVKIMNVALSSNDHDRSELTARPHRGRHRASVPVNFPL